MATDWAKFAAMRFVQVVASIILLLLLIILFVGVCTNKPVNMWGLSFNQKEFVTKYDTVTKVIHDTTVKKPLISKTVLVKSNSPKIKADLKIDSGGSGLQNNAPNYGNQAGRDINNFGIIPRKILDEDLMTLMNQVNKDAEIGFSMYGSPDAEMLAVKSQISEIFKRHGYKNVIQRHITKFTTQNTPTSIIPEYIQEKNTLIFHIPPATL